MVIPGWLIILGIILINLVSFFLFRLFIKEINKGPDIPPSGKKCKYCGKRVDDHKWFYKEVENPKGTSKVCPYCLHSNDRINNLDYWYGIPLDIYHPGLPKYIEGDLLKQKVIQGKVQKKTLFWWHMNNIISRMRACEVIKRLLKGYIHEKGK